MNPKKVHRKTLYARQLLDIIDQYTAETHSPSVDLQEAAKWAYGNGLLDKPEIDIIKILAKALARACQQDYFTDENNQPVRHWHVIRDRNSENQRTFSWFKMEDATRERMRMSAQGRRRGSLMDVLQLDRDVSYFNKHYNPGDPIEMDYNFNPDVKERRLPIEYPEAPPDSTEDQV